MILPLFLFLRRLWHFCLVLQWHGKICEHSFNENTVAGRWVVQYDVGDGADEATVLDDGAATHECVQAGTTHFYIFLTVSTHFIKIIVLCRSILTYILTQTNTEKLFFDFFNAY